MRGGTNYFINFIDQSKDLFWTVDSELTITYANDSYKKIIRKVSGKNVKQGDSVFIKEFGEAHVNNWQKIYARALSGETFEIQESYNNPETNLEEFSIVRFNPVKSDEGKVIAVACHSRDISSSIRLNNEAEIIMDASLDVICQIDKHGLFTKVSAACKDLWGYEKDEVIGQPYIAFVVEEDKEKTNKAAAEIFLGKTVKTFQNRYKRKDGGIAFNLWSVRYDPNSESIFCVARDASEQIKKEQLLLQSENRFKAMVQEGSDLIAILSEEGIYTYASPTLKGVLGRSPEEFIGKSIFEFIHPEDTENVHSSFVEITAKARVVVEPFRFQNKNGEWRWIETILTNMVENPAIKGIVANSRDITEKKLETQHLKLLETVVTNANDVVLITEAEPRDESGHKIVYVNDAFTKLTGYKPEEVIGKSPKILQGPKSDYEALGKLSKALRNWEPHEVTTINYKKNGDEFWVNFTVIPVANEQGWYTHWFSIERDVTEKKNLETATALTTTISSLFNEEVDLHGTLNKLCEEIVHLGQFSFCEIWLPDIQENFLELKAVHKRDEAADIFYNMSRQDRSLNKGQGLPGSVWVSNQLIIWENKGENHKVFTRTKAAERAGIQTIVGFPLVHHDKFMGVLQFGTKSPNVRSIHWMIQIINKLGVLIGAEIARKKTEIELTTIFEFAPDIVATCGFDGYFKKVNPYTSELLGFSEKEFTSRPSTDFMHPDDAQISKDELDKLASGIPRYNFKNRYIAKSGEIKTISWNCSPSIADELIFCIGKDITEEIKISNLLNDANQISRIGGWEVNMINQTVHWSDMVYEIHEVDKSLELDLEDAIQFYRKDYQELVKKEIEYCINTGSTVDFEAIIVTAKKNEIWVRAMGRAEIVNGECLRIYGSFQDISKNKANELRLKSVSDNLPGTIFQYQLFQDGTDKLLHLSQGAKELWDIDPLEGMRNNALIWEKILAGGDIEKVKASIRESMTSLKNWHVHFRSKSHNSKTKWLEGLGTPRRLSDGSTIWDSIILDITHLKETEKLLASASKLARVGSWEMFIQDNKEFKIFWDPTIKEILEIDPSFEPSLADGINFYKEPSRSIIDAAVNQLIKSGESFDLELELLTGKGNDIWIRCIGDAQFENGEVIRVFGSFQDINNRKLAELNQIKLTNEKSKILERIGDAFFAVDNEWRINYWNNKAELISGKKKEEIIGKILWEEYEDAIGTESYKKYHLAMKTMDTQSFEAFYETTNQWVEVNAYPSKEGLSVFFKDITEKKAFALKIQEANERFEKVAEATADAIWDWDIVNDKFYRGEGFKDLFGFETDNSLNHPKFYENNFNKEDLPKIRESVENTLLNQKAVQWEFKYRINHTSGKTKTVLDKGIILRDSSGMAIRMIGAIKDISYIIEHEDELLNLNLILKKRLTELETAYEELEQFTYIASHDLQEPLRMISSFMYQLKRKYGERMDDKGHQYMDFAIDGAKRMKQIILDLLEYSRAGKIQEEPETIDINKVLEEYKILRRKVIAEKKVVFETDKLPTIITYNTPLIQVLHNLIDNAVRYHRQDIKPIVKISCNDKDKFWEFCVEDNGIGIDNKYYNKIFIIFQRLHDRDQYQGTGIGLSIVKKQIESLGGKIWIDSKVNIGSKFYFTIPKEANYEKSPDPFSRG